ncbi:MAG: hypothetical protein JJU34_08550 [Lunatimonas sp.]|uniref:hypothetical protein n=1 Tax=Lunatimonas sp. TaxID=2060141 RepID=UPI00263B7F1F|nr:hypothetical protein [Lunatimonas sp.]MCC5937317.1 hypothetical protein [Lunatimonas sp.]
MKNLHSTIKSVVFMLLLSVLVACGSDDTPAPTPQPKTPTEMIAKSWRVISVSKGGQPVNSTSFQIAFRSNNTYGFTTTEIPGFPSEGNWQHVSAGNIIRLDNGAVDLRVVGTITETSLVFEYTYPNNKMGDVVVRFTLGSP